MDQTAPKTEVPSIEQEFEQVYHEYYSLVRAAIFRMCGERDLDDMVQEAFMRVWRARKSFRGHSNPKTWVYRVAINAGIDFLRKRQREENRRTEKDFELVASEVKDSTDHKRTIHKALQFLSEDHRAIIILHFFQDLSLEEISDALEIPPGTVKSRLFYARKALAECLRQLGVTTYE